MRKKSCIFLMVVGLLFHSCKDDDSTLGREVVFSGKVLFDDTLEPVVGIIFISGMEIGGGAFGDGVTSSWEENLDNLGQFRTSFTSDLEIDYFDLGITLLEPDIRDIVAVISDCSGNENCSRLPIDGNYENMTILVERPE